MTEQLNVVAVSGGAGFPSTTRVLSDLLTQAVRAAAEEQGIQARVQTQEVPDTATDVADATVLGLPSATLDEALRAVEQADLVVATSPVFRGSYAGIVKAFWDLVDPVVMRGKPVLLGATGGSVRHQLMIDQAFRPLFSYFGSLVLPTGVYAEVEDFEVANIPSQALAERVARAGREAVRLTERARALLP